MTDAAFRVVAIDNRKAATTLICGTLELAGLEAFAATNTLEFF
jgi:hypothetical protein